MPNPKQLVTGKTFKPSATVLTTTGVGSLVSLLILLMQKLSLTIAPSNDSELMIWSAGLLFLFTYIPSTITRIIGNGGPHRPNE